VLCGGFADEKRAKKMRQDDGAEFISGSLIALTSFFFSSCFDSAGRSSEHEYVVILLRFKKRVDLIIIKKHLLNRYSIFYNTCYQLSFRNRQ